MIGCVATEPPAPAPAPAARRRRPTQRDRVLQLLDRRGGRGVTRLEAVRDIGTLELSSRIGELEAEGCIIDREPWRGHNRFGEPVRGVAYILRHAPHDVLTAAKERVTAAGQSWRHF